MTPEEVIEVVKNEVESHTIHCTGQADFFECILNNLEELKELRIRYDLEVNMCKLAIDEINEYRKALELACEELETHPYTQWDSYEWFRYCLQKAREE